MIKRMLLAAFAVAASVCLATGAEAADPLRIADPENRNGLLGNRGDQSARARQGGQSRHRDDRACFHRCGQDRADGRRRRHGR